MRLRVPRRLVGRSARRRLSVGQLSSAAARTGQPIASLPQGNLLLGGAMLAGSAGFVNAVLLSFFQVPVSHMSGAVSHLGVAMASRPIPEALGALTIIAAFFLGSVVSGVVVGRDTALPGRRYAAVLFIQGLSLAAAGSCLYARLSTGVPLAAFACGMQNAMSSSYYGLAMRTTHVTGMVTDLGVIVGHWLRHRRFSRWKATVLAVMTGAFLAGGVLGSAHHRRTLRLLSRPCPPPAGR